MSDALPETTNRALESAWRLHISADSPHSPFSPIKNKLNRFQTAETYSSRGQLMKQLPQLCPRVFERVRVVSPIAPVRRNGKKSGVHHVELPQVL